MRRTARTDLSVMDVVVCDPALIAHRRYGWSNAGGHCLFRGEIRTAGLIAGPPEPVFLRTPS
jgi:hypothetical protein